MKNTGDNLNKRIERGLKAIAEEKVAVPHDFKAAIVRELARQLDQATPERSSQSLWQKIKNSIPAPVALPFAVGAAALVLVLVFRPGSVSVQNKSASKGAALKISSLQKETQPPALQAQRSKKKSILALKETVKQKIKIAALPEKNFEKNIEKKELSLEVKTEAKAPKKIKVIQEAGLPPMPHRQPYTLEPLQAGEPRQPAETLSGSTAPRAAAASAPVRVVVTPQPTAVTNALRDFSQVRRNVFKPGQSEYVAVLFKLDQPDHITVRVFNFNGKLIATLIEEPRSAGTHEIRWFGFNRRGEIAAAGKYIILVRARDSRQLARHKVALIR